MNEIEEKIKQINIENLIWVIYIIIIGLSIYANEFEKKYFIKNDLKAKNKYQNLLILIFIIAIIVYTYFLIDNYKSVKNLKPTDSQKKKNLNELSLFGSILILVSGILFLYIAIVDNELDVELAFS